MCEVSTTRWTWWWKLVTPGSGSTRWDDWAAGPTAKIYVSGKVYRDIILFLYIYIVVDYIFRKEYGAIVVDFNNVECIISALFYEDDKSCMYYSKKIR